MWNSSLQLKMFATQKLGTGRLHGPTRKLFRGGAPQLQRPPPGVRDAEWEERPMSHFAAIERLRRYLRTLRKPMK